MRELVVLVGLPGSGKTAFQRTHPDWAVVSRGTIRQGVFRCTYDADIEETVDRIYTAALIETLDSSANVVCIDGPNLTRTERQKYVELAHLCRRRPIAHVMPMSEPDVHFDRLQRNLKRLALEKPYLKVRKFPRHLFDAMADQYEEIDLVEEGFADVQWENVASSSGVTSGSRQAGRRKTAPKEPLPLFIR